VIVLDTNVVSEAFKPEPHPKIRNWMNNQSAETLFISSVTVAELLFGVGALPNGKRKTMLSDVVKGLILQFQGRVLPFDIEAAQHYAALAVKAKLNGQGFPTPDGYIAAIASSRSFIIASRDTAPFEAASIQVINPWKT
jgi:toxin FitB